ncbi:MAG: sulfite exporter TauE/SafE family protein [Gemmataceae bacterium]|nr:sulfite exporter TauE/SafE family protein [Gemmataceae bacterium]MDW8241861.1 sulfite exporter TauE/SafE family protein [Thermogemmata sp.]
MHVAVTFLFGALVGFALGLTGGGGSILAVPLLIYGVGLPAREAIGVSLLVVGLTALVGAVGRWFRREVDVAAGLLFALPCMAGVPLGAFVGKHLSEPVLMLGYAGLTGLVAQRMWSRAKKNSAPVTASLVRQGRIAPLKVDAYSRSFSDHTRGLDAPTTPAMTTLHPAHASEGQGSEPSSSLTQQDVASSDPRKSLCYRSAIRSVVLFVMTGLATGTLAGLFGIGGGFLIVPALVLVARLEMHRAAATSLLVIALIGLSGTTSFLLAGHFPAPAITLLFASGGLTGMAFGVKLSRLLAGPTLQRLFAVMLVVVATVILVETVPQFFSGAVTFLSAPVSEH